MEKADVLIIGGSAAGVTCAITAKRHYPDKNVVIIRKEDKVLIPCGIPYIFGTVGSPDKNLIPDAVLEKNKIGLIVDEVVSIDKDEKIVSTKKSENIRYEKLVFATGSLPLILPLPGIEKKNVFTIQKDITYLQKISDSLDSADNLVIIGGGFIGVEFADECKKRKKDLNVTIVELLPHCLLLACDEDFCIEAEKKLTQRGIKLLTNKKAKSILCNEKVEYVKLTSGEELQADVVILGVGVIPNTELAQKAGVKVSDRKEIHVNRYMRTSDKDIFACGDCCEKFSYFTKKPSGLRLASIAANEARIAGANLFKLKRQNEGVIGIVATVIGDLSIGAAGLTEDAAKKSGFDVIAEVASAPDRHPGGMPGMKNLNLKMIFSRDSGIILGGQVCGGVSAGELLNAISTAILTKMNVEEISTFQMGTHPALTASPIAYQIVNAAESVLSKMKTPSILIVEDDKDFVSVVETILSRKLYTIQVAYNREEAMKKIKEKKPDLILLDIMMEKANDGFVICEEIKSDPEYWDIPIIAISSIASQTGFSPEVGEHFKADTFIEKPVKSNDLLENVEKYLKRMHLV